VKTRKTRGEALALWMPAFGMIEGGRFDGHRYSFHRFVIVDGQLCIEASVTPPHWPFPKTRLLELGDYKTLYAVPGERAKRIEANALIAAAAAEARQRASTPGPAGRPAAGG
jgi:hypothetical protein